MDDLPRIHAVSTSNLRTLLLELNLSNYVLIAVIGDKDGIDNWCIGPFRYVFQFNGDRTVYLVGQKDLHLEGDNFDFVMYLHIYRKPCVSVTVVHWIQFFKILDLETDIWCSLSEIPGNIALPCWVMYRTWLRDELQCSYIPGPEW